MFLICHVTCDNVVRESCDNMVEFPLIISLHPAKFGCHRRCAREEILFFVCHMTSQDFVIKSEFPSSLVTTLQSLVIIDLLEEEILRFQFVT